MAGSYAYVADGPGGLEVFDVSDPATPALLGKAPTVEEVRDVAVAGSLACVACSNGVMQVWDLSDPRQPRLLTRYMPAIGAARVAMSGNRAFVVSPGLFRWIEAIDLSEPNNSRSAAGPYFVGSLGFPTAISVGYAEDPDERWQLTDLTDSSDPKLIGGYRTMAAALGIALSDHCAFRIDWETRRLEV